MVNTPSNQKPDSANERSDPAAVRQSFRVPVEYQDDIAVMLNDKSYRVIDISPEGINIAIQDQTLFMAGQLIEDCELIVPDSRIKNLTARIIHCACEIDKDWTCGIQWIDLTDTAQGDIVRVVLKIKQKLRQSPSK